MLQVESNVYNMDFWMLRKVEYRDLKISPSENYRELHERLRRTKEHLPTGTAIVTIPSTITDVDEAIKYAQERLNFISHILSFAQGRDIYFMPYVCYEIVNDVKKEIKTLWSSIRVGKARGGKLIYSEGLERFVNMVAPKLENEEFVEKTGIMYAIQWYNEAQNLTVPEIKFPALWISLEILANAYYKQHREDFLLKADEWRRLIKKIRETLDQMEINSQTKNRILSQIGRIREGSITDKISRLLDEYDLSQYFEDVRKIKKIRDDIFHGRRLNHSEVNSFENMRKLERLLEKLILKVLDVYDEDFVHSAIKRDSLLAVS